MKRLSTPSFMIIGAIALSACLLGATLWVTTRSVAAPHTPDIPTQITLPNSTAAYNGVMTPSTRLYAPWMLGGTSSLRVYNAGASPATVYATFRYSTVVAVETTVIQPGAIDEIQSTVVPTATRFSAIITSTQPIVAVANDIGPDGVYATSYAAMSADLGHTTLVLPDILFGAAGSGSASQIAVQNVGTLSTSATIFYTRTDEFASTTWSQTLPTLGPDQVFIFDPGDAGLPTDFVGVATVQADQPLVAAVNNPTFLEIGATHPRRAYVYRVPLPGANATGNRPLYFPLLVNAFEGWRNSEIQIVNKSPSIVNFFLEIDDASYLKSLSSWAAQSYPQHKSEAPSPAGEAVAGQVLNGQWLESIVWFNGKGNFVNDFLAAYTTPRVGGTTWYLPYADQGANFATYVALQNLTGSTATFTMTYHTITGTLSTYVGTIAPSKMALQAGGSGLPSQFTGGVVVQTDQPVAAVAVTAGQLVLDEINFLPIVSKGN